MFKIEKILTKEQKNLTKKVFEKINNLIKYIEIIEFDNELEVYFEEKLLFIITSELTYVNKRDLYFKIPFELTRTLTTMKFDDNKEEIENIVNAFLMEPLKQKNKLEHELFFDKLSKYNKDIILKVTEYVKRIYPYTIFEQTKGKYYFEFEGIMFNFAYDSKDGLVFYYKIKIEEKSNKIMAKDVNIIIKELERYRASKDLNTRDNSKNISISSDESYKPTNKIEYKMVDYKPKLHISNDTLSYKVCYFTFNKLNDPNSFEKARYTVYLVDKDLNRISQLSELYLEKEVSEYRITLSILDSVNRFKLDKVILVITYKNVDKSSYLDMIEFKYVPKNGIWK